MYTVEKDLGDTRELWTVCGTFEYPEEALEHYRRLIADTERCLRVVDQTTGRAVAKFYPKEVR